MNDQNIITNPSLIGPILQDHDAARCVIVHSASTNTCECTDEIPCLEHVLARSEKDLRGWREHIDGMIDLAGP